MEKKRVSKKVTAARPVDACTARTILLMSLLTVMAGAAIAPALGIIKAHFSDAPAMLLQFIVSMPLLSAALYLGQFVSPIIVTPASHILFGSADLTGPYKVGIVLCLLFMVQVYLTRHFQSLPPK